MPKSKGRRAKPSTRARETLAAQRAASQRKKRTLAQYRAWRATGWSFVGVASLMGVVHFAGHLGFFGAQPSTMVDLLAGYPMAAVLGVAGAIILSKA